MNLKTHNKHFESVMTLAKKQKASKEAGVNFANILIAQQRELVSSFIAPQQLQAQANSSLDIDIISASSQMLNPPKTNINLNDKKQNIAYGYSVDSNGFMGADFNKAAGLPEDFKIHKNTLKDIEELNKNYYLYGMLSGPNLFEFIDMADTIKQHYRLFTQVTNNITDKKYEFTQRDLNQLPTGYSYDLNQDIVENGNFMVDMTKITVNDIFKSKQDIADAYEFKDKLPALVNFSFKELNFNPYANNKNIGFKVDESIYRKNDNLSREELFLGFLQSIGPSISASGRTKLNADNLNYLKEISKESFTPTYYNFKATIKDDVLLKEILEQIKQDINKRQS